MTARQAQRETLPGPSGQRAVDIPPMPRSGEAWLTRLVRMPALMVLYESVPDVPVHFYLLSDGRWAVMW